MAWTKTSVNENYIRLETTTAVACAGTAAINSDTITEDIGDQYLLVGVNIVTAMENVVADLDVEVSWDGTNFFTAQDDAIADTTPDLTGEKRAVGNLVSYNAPYYRLTMNNAGVDLGTQASASYTTALAGANNDLVYTAVTSGVDGNSITIAYIDPGGPSEALSVVVTGTDIVVNLATNGGSAIISTAAEVEAAVEADVDAAALVTVANSGADDGTGVVTALAEQSLAGGYTAGTVKFIAVARVRNSFNSAFYV